VPNVAISETREPNSLVERVVRQTPRLARRVRGLSDRTIAWLFITPTIALLLAINIFPLIWAIRLSFTNFKSNMPSLAVHWSQELRGYLER
jgi:multiple sugar transport system permease protein